MLRKKNLLICLAAVVLCVAGIALAKAVKVDLQNPAGLPADDQDAGATGRAVLNYAKGADKTEVQFNCQGLTPGATYVIGIVDVGIFPGTGTYTPLPNGKLMVHAAVSGDVSAEHVGVAREIPSDPDDHIVVLQSPPY